MSHVSEYKDLIAWAVILLNLFVNFQIKIEVGKILLKMSEDYVKKSDCEKCQDKNSEVHKTLFDRLENRK